MNLSNFKKRTLFPLLSLLVLCPACADSLDQEVDRAITKGMERATEQSLLLAQTLENQPGRLPRTFERGELITSDYKWWCSGFFPGVLWYVYENSNDPQILHYARMYTQRVDSAKFQKDHDLGFMLLCSFGNGLRLTRDASYARTLMQGADKLMTCFYPSVGVTRSWYWNTQEWQCPVIIDNMMNLQLLLWASPQNGNQTYAQAAISHADKTLLEHYRPDNSCYHVVSYDTITGQPHKKCTFQGLNDSSSWSRGQAWGLYGFTYMYRETGRKTYLEMAQKIAAYLIEHPRMPKDMIPFWDFDDPKIPNTYRDASAAAIMASALIDLSQLVSEQEGKSYLEVAKRQIITLSSDEYLSPKGENGGFILRHSVGWLGNDSEVDAPLTYADYYYLEAITRYKALVGK